MDEEDSLDKQVLLHLCHLQDLVPNTFGFARHSLQQPPAWEERVLAEGCRGFRLGNVELLVDFTPKIDPTNLASYPRLT